ncbi:MAG: lipopolysaccharide heptosyltransferase I [Magnetococcales bacterium]|nr:lipopolysaccharide heptosyltransferase I [Magnetococcales bacterium]
MEKSRSGRILLIKTSSMGDIIHTLPAVSDLKRYRPELALDWVVEEPFAEIPAWHSHVDRIIPIALRRWRKTPWQTYKKGEVGRFITHLRRSHYSAIIDAQSLIKSAVLARLARGDGCYGPDQSWARERLAVSLYDHPVPSGHCQPVIRRTRQLFAGALGYPLPDTPPDFGLDKGPPPLTLANTTDSVLSYLGRPFCLFLHGTAWASKMWPESYWMELARVVTEKSGWKVYLPWGSEAERHRAMRMAKAVGEKVEVLPFMTIGGLAGLISQARGVVGLDSGFAHLAAAMGVPCVTLFGATNPAYSGVPGLQQRFLQTQFPCSPCMKRRCQLKPPYSPDPPCFATVGPEQVWQTLRELLQLNA